MEGDEGAGDAARDPDVELSHPEEAPQDKTAGPLDSPTDARRQRRWIVLLGVGFEGGFVGVAFLLGWLLGQPPLERFEWSLAGAAAGIAACLPMLLVAAVLLRWPVGPLGSIKQFSEGIIRPLFAPCNLLDLGLISLLAGLGEEMLFRGVLQPVFVGRWGFWPGLAAASVLFGLLHPITPAYIGLAAAVSVYLGYIFEASGSLMAVVVAHALYDFVMLVYLVRHRTRG